MPELPDVEAYIAALSPRIVGERLERVRLRGGGFVLRTLEPPIAQAAGRVVRDIYGASANASASAWTTISGSSST